jgi:hypothetical protein
MKSSCEDQRCSSSLPGTLYAVVDPCEVKSVTARELAVTRAVPESEEEAIVPLVVVMYVNVVVVGTVVIVYVPFKAVFVRPEITTESPAAIVCAVDVVIVAVELVRATLLIVLVISPCQL